MAKSANFKILVAFEALERFTAIIRPQEMAEVGAVQFKSESNVNTAAQSRRSDPNPKPNHQAKEDM
jgi:hypothetical protein